MRDGAHASHESKHDDPLPADFGQHSSTLPLAEAGLQLGVCYYVRCAVLGDSQGEEPSGDAAGRVLLGGTLTPKPVALSSA